MKVSPQIRRGVAEDVPQLVHLDALVHILEPFPRMFDRLQRRRLNAGFKISGRWHIDYKLSRQGDIKRVQQACFMPLAGQIAVCWCWRHGFTIQLATSWVKRAATAVRPS